MIGQKDGEYAPIFFPVHVVGLSRSQNLSSAFQHNYSVFRNTTRFLEGHPAEVTSCVQERYKGLAIGLANLMTDRRFHLSASVYTEVSDVEAEINGWVTYDRKVGTFGLPAHQALSI